LAKACFPIAPIPRIEPSNRRMSVFSLDLRLSVFIRG